MKAIEAIEEVNLLAPNQYENDLKLKWLRDLDGKIYRELIEIHEDAETAGRFKAADYTDEETELLIGPPYDRDIYVSFLRGKIAQADAETERYNLYASVFNSEYGQFAAWYNRTTPPKRFPGWRY